MAVPEIDFNKLSDEDLAKIWIQLPHLKEGGDCSNQFE
jgi:hypothetical protein